MPYVTALPLVQARASAEASEGASPHRSTHSGQCTVQPDRARDSVPVFAGTRRPQPAQSAGYLLDRLFRVFILVYGFLVTDCLGLSATPTESFRESLRKVCERGGVCGGKTGLTLGIRNGWRDFRFREKFLEREEIRKRFQVENQGFRGAWEREWRTKVGIARLDLRAERGTRTEERKETWRQNAQKGGESARKEVGKVCTAEMG